MHIMRATQPDIFINVNYIQYRLREASGQGLTCGRAIFSKFSELSMSLSYLGSYQERNTNTELIASC